MTLPGYWDTAPVMLRPQLLAQLDVVPHVPLTLIVAPAGFGKTTLLHSWWAAQRESIQQERYPRIAWLTVDSDRANPTNLGLAMLQTAYPAQTGDGYGRVRYYPYWDATNLQGFADAFAELTEPLILVLDDFHLVEQRAYDLLAALIERQPPNLHLVIASRVDPSFPLARLRAAGRLRELRAAELRFSAEETAQLITQLLGYSLQSETIATLHERTEGWAAGLQLAILALQSADDPDAYAMTFSSRHRFVLDYFTDEVLNQLDEPLRQALLMTSVPDRICAGLCDALLSVSFPDSDDEWQPRAGSQTLLEAVEAANLFLVPLDDERRWYRYHYLFIDLLRYQLRQRYPARIPELHRHTARWFAKQGMIDEAMQHALAAQDTPLIADLIEQVGRARLMQGELAVLQRWLAVLPQSEIDARLSLALLQAWVLAWSYEPAAVARLLPAIEERLAALPPPQNQFNAELLALQAFVAQSSDNWHLAVQLSEKALAIADHPFVHGFVYAGMGEAFWLSEDTERASHCHQCALEHACRSGALMQLVSTSHTLAQMDLLQGRLSAAAATYDYATMLLAARGQAARPFAEMLALGRGIIAYEHYDLAAARRLVEHGLAQIDQCGLVIYEPSARIDLARIAAAQGDTHTAHRELLSARQSIQRIITDSGGQTPAWLGIVQLREIDVLLALGDLPAAARWAVARSAPLVAPMVEPIRQFALAQVMVACADRPALVALLTDTEGGIALDNVVQLMRDCRQRLTAWGLDLLVLELYVLEAVFFARRDPLAAQSALFEALAFAAPEQIIRPFVAHSAVLIPLLQQALKGRLSESSRLLVEQMLQHSGAALSSATPPAQVESLSPRERDVLPLLAAGFSYREIAAALTIAPDTARTHIKNIYGKLQVQNRIQAVERARALALL